INSWQESPPALIVHPPRRSVRPTSPAGFVVVVGAGSAACCVSAGSGCDVTCPSVVLLASAVVGGRPPVSVGWGCDLPSGGNPMAPIEPQPHRATARATGRNRAAKIKIRFLLEQPSKRRIADLSQDCSGFRAHN